jgi:plasmid replication initiation protein
LGTIFARIPEEREELLLVYYLCEKTGGKEKPGDDFTEFKWVAPEELEKYFTTSFHPNLKEYILNLK